MPQRWPTFIPPFLGLMKGLSWKMWSFDSNQPVLCRPSSEGWGNWKGRSKFLSHVEPITTGMWRVATACINHLTCFALSLHDSGHTHQVKHRTLRMQLYVQWAPALGTRTAHAFAHAGLAGVSTREPIPSGECTQLSLKQNCRAVGTGIVDNAFWDLLKSKEALAHHRALTIYGYQLNSTRDQLQLIQPFQRSYLTWIKQNTASHAEHFQRDKGKEKKRKENTPLVVITQPAWLRGEGAT